MWLRNILLTAGLMFSVSCTSQNEGAEELGAVLKGDLKGVFFIQIFDGYFPIPNRYLVSANGETDTLEFFSRSILELKILSSSYVGPVGVGGIAIGPISKCEFCGNFDFNSRGMRAENVPGIKYINGKKIFHVQSRHLLLYDDQKYMLISDDDEAYWEKALNMFIKIKDVSTHDLGLTGSESSSFSEKNSGSMGSD